MRLNDVWRLSKLWYGDRLAADFRGMSKERVARIFTTLGLTGDFWASG